MTTEDNGNVGLLKPTSSSNEDLSEYTDADESISAPTEFLAEFLSAVMLKDYVTALKYCKLILQYEPNNATAKEFYPLILEKLQNNTNNEEHYSDEDNEEDSSSSSSDSDSSSSSSDDSSEQEEEEDEEDDDDDDEVDEEEEVEVGGDCNRSGGDKQSKGSSDGDATTGSYSSLEDDEAVENNDQQLAALAAKYQIDNVNLGNGNKIYGTNLLSNSITTATSQKQYEDKLLSNLGSFIAPPVSHHNSHHQQIGVVGPFGTTASSDSESPTEPVSQQTVQIAAMLRARVVPTKQ